MVRLLVNYKIYGAALLLKFETILKAFKAKGIG